MNHPGFYSLVRFCPDIERGEAVNVDVIVGAPGLGMRVKTADRNEYVKRRFGAESFDNTRLTLIKDGFAERLKEIEPTAPVATSADALTRTVASAAGASSSTASCGRACCAQCLPIIKRALVEGPAASRRTTMRISAG